jgi:hypothetical protein
MWGSEGWFRKLVPGYLSYFKPSFHPWERDTTELLRTARSQMGLDPEGREPHAQQVA